MKAEINLKGHRVDDLLLALDEVRNKIQQGYTLSYDGNETGEYEYSINGEEIEIYQCRFDNQTKDFDDYDDALDFYREQVDNQEIKRKQVQLIGLDVNGEFVEVVKDNHE